ncbi:hypothetical protein HanRHA438_Chr09g0384421 [Helianthus annuus]|nr:hypothetical protein HanRHA438_Chr09g0384421 [Helianthus annuus]
MWVFPQWGQEYKAARRNEDPQRNHRRLVSCRQGGSRLHGQAGAVERCHLDYPHRASHFRSRISNTVHPHSNPW